MAEVAGLALGVAGLFGLFTSCIDAFELVQLGRTKDRDLLLLHQKLESQKARFVLWGQSMYLDSEKRCLLRDNNMAYRATERTMQQADSLFREGTDLAARYGLREKQNSEMPSDTHDVSHRPLQKIPGRFRTTRTLASRLRRVTKQAPDQSPVKVMRLSIVDQSRFSCLIQHLQELVNDIESLADSIEGLDRRRKMAEEEIASIEEAELEVAAAMGDDQPDL